MGLGKVEFERTYSDCGKFRQTYEGNVYIEKSQLGRAPEGWNIEGKETPFAKCIVKKFKRMHSFFACEWEKDLRVLKEAQFWSKKFNQKKVSAIDIQFADAFMAKVCERGCVKQTSLCTEDGCCKHTCDYSRAEVQKEELVCVEPKLDGKFVKANCNQGYVEEPSADNREFLEVAQAFSHWTWAESGKSLLVCDLQGVYETDTSNNAKKWKFTDPAIHSANPDTQDFGLTDLGPRGINAFFFSHRCNDLCQSLPRPETAIDLGFPNPAPGTRFSFENVQVSSEVHSQEDFGDIRNDNFRGTCYAQSVATIVRAAERRIVGRELVAHHRIAAALVREHGTKGIEKVRMIELLQSECHPRKMQCEEVNELLAAKALDFGRAILVDFRLTDSQWSEFSRFFERSPYGILTKLPDSSAQETDGHACVIIGHDNGAHASWKIKNSWGDEFADHGYFKVSKELLQGCHPRFFDVFWYQHELSLDDFKAYIEHCQASRLHSVCLSTLFRLLISSRAC
eukprot:Skav207793  [mRNA]  locus=scaffold710:104864:106393:- [translate_table: standard]